MYYARIQLKVNRKASVEHLNIIHHNLIGPRESKYKQVNNKYYWKIRSRFLHLIGR